MAKNLFLNRLVGANNAVTVYGGARIFVRKPYGSKDLLVARSVNTTDRNGQPRQATVVEVNGSYKVDDLLARQIKYFYGVVPAETYLNVRVSIWDKMGENLLKFPPNEGDSYMFFFSKVELQQFNRKDGNVGYQLQGTAYDFCRLRTADENAAMRTNNSTSHSVSAPVQVPPQTTATTAVQAPVRIMAAPAAAPAPAYNTPQYTADDFAAIDDSDDLPF